MKPKKAPSSADAWDIPACEALIRDLWALRESMLRNEVRLASWLRQADATHTASATNLAHYLALRRHDLRSLQEQLARMGLSSLGRAETHVLANLDKVLGIMERLYETNPDWCEPSALLVKLAREGKIKEFTGISDPYEEPTRAELVVDTQDVDVDHCAHQVILKLESMGLIKA